MIYIGMDDTDNKNSRGTGNLARKIASLLTDDFTVLGVVRHQLSKDQRVPCTAKNSSATIILKKNNKISIPEIFKFVKKEMLDDFQPGSYPGLCVASDIHYSITDFGRRAQEELVMQREARDLAQRHTMMLEGLGGDEDGVIGALAAVGLSSFGEDGRYVLCGSIRELSGLKNVAEVLDSGVTEIRTMEGEPVTEGFVKTDKIRPARRESRPIAYVEWNGDHWNPLKLD